VLIVVTATVLCRTPAFVKPFMDGDEAIYASVAALLHAGGHLYGDGGVDNKFPAIFWTYAAVFKLCGCWSLHAVQVLALLFVLATAAVLARTAHRLAGPRAGFWAALFYGVFTSVYYPKMLAANTEVFMMLPLCGSVLALLDRRFLLAGVLIGLGCLWKQVALANLLVALVLVRRRRDLGALALGVLGALGAAAVVLAAQGSLGGLWRWAVRALLSHYGPSAWSPRALAANFATGFLPFMGASLVLWPLALRTVVRVRARGPIAAWLFASLIAVSAGGHFFGHYFIQLVGPLALAAALELAHQGPRGRAWVALSTALPALGFAIAAVRFEPWSASLGRPPRDFAAVADWMRTHTAPDQRVFVWGLSAQLYLASQRLPATRFVGFLRGLARERGEPPEQAWDCAPDVWPQVAADFAAHPPMLLVDTSSVPEAHFVGYPLARLPPLAQHFVGYQRAVTVSGVTIFRRTAHPPGLTQRARSIMNGM